MFERLQEFPLSEIGKGWPHYKKLLTDDLFVIPEDKSNPLDSQILYFRLMMWFAIKKCFFDNNIHFNM